MVWRLIKAPRAKNALDALHTAAHGGPRRLLPRVARFSGLAAKAMELLRAGQPAIFKIRGGKVEATLRDLTEADIRLNQWGKRMSENQRNSRLSSLAQFANDYPAHPLKRIALEEIAELRGR